MDDDGSNDISWEEWRGFLLLSPGSELGDVVNYWRKSTVSFNSIDLQLNPGGFIIQLGLVFTIL